MIETAYTRAVSAAIASLFEGMAVAVPMKRTHPARKLRNAKALAYHNRRREAAISGHKKRNKFTAYTRAKYKDGVRKEDEHLAAKRLRIDTETSSAAK